MKQKLIKLLCEYNKINCDEYYPPILEEAIRKSYRKHNDFVRKLELCTNHLCPAWRNIPLQAAFITHKSARALLAFKGEMRVSVYQYYFLRHRQRLLFPQLPCVAVKGGNGHVSFYPLEVLDVIINPTNDQEEKVK